MRTLHVLEEYIIVCSKFDQISGHKWFEEDDKIKL